MSGDQPAKSLMEKLGIKSGFHIAVLNPPYNFVQSLVTIRDSLRAMHTEVDVEGAKDLDVIIYFSRGRRGLEENLPTLKGQLKPDGVLWIGWRKKTKGQKTDLDEGIVREAGQKHGMADVKVMAVDDDWSILKFVARAAENK